MGYTLNPRPAPLLFPNNDLFAQSNQLLPLAEGVSHIQVDHVYLFPCSFSIDLRLILLSALLFPHPKQHQKPSHVHVIYIRYWYG